MSEPVTEIVSIPFKKDVDLNSGEGKTTWDGTLKTIASQRGFEGLFWGYQIESPSVMQMAIGWESLEAHQAFMTSDIYGPFLEAMAPFMDGQPQMVHLKLPITSQDSDSSPFNAPVTECISLYFDSSFDELAFDKSFSNFVADLGTVQGVETMGLQGGWGIEPQKFESEGKEKKFFGGFIGWSSVDSHMALRKREEFPKVVSHLREGPENLKMHHVAFKRYEA